MPHASAHSLAIGMRPHSCRSPHNCQLRVTHSRCSLRKTFFVPLAPSPLRGGLGRGFPSARPMSSTFVGSLPGFRAKSPCSLSRYVLGIQPPPRKEGVRSDDDMPSTHRRRAKLVLRLGTNGPLKKSVTAFPFRARSGELRVLGTHKRIAVPGRTAPRTVMPQRVRTLAGWIHQHLDGKQGNRGVETSRRNDWLEYPIRMAAALQIDVFEVQRIMAEAARRPEKSPISPHEIGRAHV